MKRYKLCNTCSFWHLTYIAYPCTECNGDEPPITCLDCRVSSQCHKIGRRPEVLERGSMKPCKYFEWN